MEIKTINLTDAQIKALSLQMQARPNLISTLPIFDAADTVLPPVLGEADISALMVALRPLSSVQASVLLINDGLMRLQFSLRGENCVLTGREDNINTLLPCEVADAATMVMAHLAQGGEPQKRKVALTLTQNAFLLLLAASDAYKMTYLEDLLRHTAQEPRLTGDALGRAVAEGYETPDLRWLLPFGLFGMGEPPKLDVETGIAELRERGVLESEGIILTGDGALFVDELMNRIAAAHIHSVYSQGMAPSASHVLFIRTLNTLWCAKFIDAEVTLLSLDIDEACELMAAMLTQKDEPGDSPPPEAPEPPARFCINCGHKIEANTMFCTNCGAKQG